MSNETLKQIIAEMRSWWWTADRTPTVALRDWADRIERTLASSTEDFEAWVTRNHPLLPLTTAGNGTTAVYVNDITEAMSQAWHAARTGGEDGWRPIEAALKQADQALEECGFASDQSVRTDIHRALNVIAARASGKDGEDAARWRYTRDHMTPALVADLFKLNAQDYAPDESVKPFSQTDKWVDRIVDAARATEAER